jgi:Lon-like ATP-dependent protease
MEVLEVAGYVSAEKMSIAERYLSPQAKDSSGLKDVDITLHPEAIEALIRYYCRESGVRNLKKHIDKIYRKAAFKIVSDLGEDALPEPSQEALTASTNETDASSTNPLQRLYLEMRLLSRRKNRGRLSLLVPDNL